MRIADPHSYFLDNDVRWNGQPILDAKRDWDPHGLLNPGKLKVLEAQ
jgi:FAD/FMN-containing dehydrogenase